MSQTLLKLTCKLTPNQKKFTAEVIGTFIVVVFATGSVVINSRLHGALGIPFIAFAPFVGIAIGVYSFGKISMAHFNPAVSLGFLITKHITKTQLILYNRRNNWCPVRKSIRKISDRFQCQSGSKCTKL